MIKIINIKSGEKYDIYCGRANKYYNLPQSKWANWYIIGKDGNRDEVIEKHRLRINSEPDLLESLPELKDQILACYCVPEKCHCETLKDLAESKWIKNWFSNMLPFEIPLLYQDIEFKTVENFYQAMKLPKNKLYERQSIALMSPFECKKEIRNKNKYLWDIEWSKEKSLKVMEYALRWKFQKGTDWHRKLMITKELNIPIVEYNTWHDTFWGVDLHSRIGQNHLGKILMKIRDEI